MYFIKAPSVSCILWRAHGLHFGFEACGVEFLCLCLSMRESGYDASLLSKVDTGSNSLACRFRFDLPTMHQSRNLLWLRSNDGCEFCVREQAWLGTKALLTCDRDALIFLWLFQVLFCCTMKTRTSCFLDENNHLLLSDGATHVKMDKLKLDTINSVVDQRSCSSIYLSG